jgi:hypothetical protein
MGAFFGIRPIIGLVAALSLVAWFATSSAVASTPFVDIHSAGPLTDIYIGNDLSCQVRSGGFSSTEFFPNASGPGDCGTFLFTGTDTADEALFGPDFGNHAGGTHTTGDFSVTETPFTPVSQTMSGAGTAANPYQVTTVVKTSETTQNEAVIQLQVTEVDSYIVGNDFYRTAITVQNIGNTDEDAVADLYHAGDCQLRGSDNGFGAPEPTANPDTAACTPNVLGNPPSAQEVFAPITTGDDWVQTNVPAIWADLGSNLLDECLSCRGTVQDNAMGIQYPIDSLEVGQTDATVSFDTTIVDTVPTGGFSFTGSPGNAIGGTVATFTDPNTSATANAYSASINWGDGTASPGTITGGSGSFNVAGNHTYSASGTYPVSVTITPVGTSQGGSTVADLAAITAPPSPVITGTPTTPAVTAPPSPVTTGTPTVTGPNGAAFAGSVNPEGLTTTAYFQYGIPPNAQGPEGAGPTFTQFTPTQTVGSDFSDHAVSASVSGLVPNELYDVQLVATNSAGTSYGPIEAFTTTANNAPPAPVLGQQVNVQLVSGHVWIKPPPGKSLGPAGDRAALSKGQGFVPLTEARQVPTGSEVDALHGSLKIVSNTGKVGKTQTATLAGGVFKVTQVRKGISKGMTDFNLIESAFQGAPTYATCKSNYKQTGYATIASLSSKTLQLLKVSGHGKFRTTGRFSSATVRGTIYTVADRCDGTLTHVIRDTVLVDDFARHKIILLHAGQSYLAKKP